jgi:hypothetical protein
MGNMGINRLIVIDSMRLNLIDLTIGKRELKVSLCLSCDQG